MKRGFHLPLEKKIGRICWYLFSSAIFTLVFGGILSIIEGGQFLRICSYVFFFFSAPLVVAAALAAFSIVPEDLEFGFGYGLYYGTLAVSAFLDWINPEIPYNICLEVGFVICALTCYIVYLKHYKR